MLHDLMLLDDVDFVRAAYRLVLKRETDAEGETTYVGLLRGGHAKTSVLVALAESAEGRAAGSSVPGLAALLRRQRIRRMPVLGPVMAGLRRLVQPAPAFDAEQAFRSQVSGMQHATLDASALLLAAIKDLQSELSGAMRAQWAAGQQATLDKTNEVLQATRQLQSELDTVIRTELVSRQQATLEQMGQLLAGVKELQLRQAGVERTLARMDRRNSEAKLRARG